MIRQVAGAWPRQPAACSKWYWICMQHSNAGPSGRAMVLSRQCLIWLGWTCLHRPEEPAGISQHVVCTLRDCFGGGEGIRQQQPKQRGSACGPAGCTDPCNIIIDTMQHRDIRLSQVCDTSKGKCIVGILVCSVQITPTFPNIPACVP